MEATHPSSTIITRGNEAADGSLLDFQTLTTINKISMNHAETAHISSTIITLGNKRAHGNVLGFTGTAQSIQNVHIIPSACMTHHWTLPNFMIWLLEIVPYKWSYIEQLIKAKYEDAQRNTAKWHVSKKVIKAKYLKLLKYMNYSVHNSPILISDHNCLGYEKIDCYNKEENCKCWYIYLAD